MGLFDEQGQVEVLVAEDDAFSRRLLVRTLEKWGYATISAADGLEALEILTRDGAPAIAIMDWMMPGLDGPGVCRRLRQAGACAADARPYVIMLTAKMDGDDLAEAVEAGADDFAVKSFDMRELQLRLRAGERIVRLQRQLACRDGGACPPEDAQPAGICDTRQEPT